MADKKAKKVTKKNLYKATENFKVFMGGPGFLTDEQHELLLKGSSVDLTGVPQKQMEYFIINNLIEEI